MSEVNFASRKNILVSKPPNNYPACWFHIPDENEVAENTNIPSYDVELSKNSMERTAQLTSVLKNSNSEDDDWESKVLKYGWTIKQTKIFNKTVQILDHDHLARLANVDSKRHEVIQVRVAIDKSADRMRQALASVNWETSTIQWLHSVLMEYLPPSYLASYLDIMQTLKSKIPSLIDKMIFWRPGNVSQDLLGLILKKPWQPSLSNKYRKLPGSALIVVIPPLPRLTPQPSRVQRMYTLFTTMAPILPVQLQINQIMTQKQSLQSIAEQIVSITRTKIQELKAENPDRRLILVGMHASSALALQVALVEQVSGVVCFGFSYNTVHGPRGQPDDQMLVISTPILFMIGQNAARSSEEEVEYFREKLTAPTTLLSVGGGDDYLRVNKKKRKLEGVTQEMVDNMIVDEIAEFATKCLQRPLPIKLKSITNIGNVSIHRQIDSSTGQMRKRKISQSMESDANIKVTKMKPSKLMRPTSTTHFVNNTDAIEMAVQSILPNTEVKHVKPTQQRISTATSGTRLKILSQGQFTTLKQQPGTSQKYITIDNKQIGHKNIISLASRGPQNRININSRPSTPVSQNQYITGTRIATVGKLPVMQTQQQREQTTNFSPPKFTIVRSTASTPNTSYTTEGEMSGSNIFDLPIVFADNEGNIEDESVVSDNSVIEIPDESPPPPPQHLPKSNKVILKTSSLPSYVTTGTLTKNKNILIQKPANKMLVLNGSVLGRPVSASNIMIPKSTQPLRVQKFVSTVNQPDIQLRTTTPASKKIEILNNTIIKPANIVPSTSASQIKPMTFVNLADAKPITGQRLSLPIATGNVKAGQHIVIKTANLKQFTLNNRQFSNLTVKRLNVLPSTTTATVTTNTDQQQQKAKIVFKNPNQ